MRGNCANTLAWLATDSDLSTAKNLPNEEPPENDERNSQDQYPNPEGLTVRGFLRLSLEMSLGTHHFPDLFRRVFWRKTRLNPHLVIPKINPQFGLTH
jgi:hypothetical protein